MDYICATLLVTYQFYAVFDRVLIQQPRKYRILVALLVSALFLQHAYYMMVVHFDFGYHIKVNVIIGKFIKRYVYHRSRLL